MIRMESLRVVLAMAASRQLHLLQFDVTTAFLNGVLEEVIFMKQPESFNDGTGRVCRLKKSLYGLKQAPRCWNATFVKSLLDLGLRQCELDPCVFTGAGASTLILGIYVDDGLIAGEDDREMRAISSSHCSR